MFSYLISTLALLFFCFTTQALAGSTVDLAVSTADLFPTIAKAINKNYKKDKNIDGENIFQLMAKPTAYRNRKLFWHYPHYSNQGGKPGSANREGNYKLTYHSQDATTELYDIANDMGEKKNIASANPEVVKRMNKKLFTWLD